MGASKPAPSVAEGPGAGQGANPNNHNVADAPEGGEQSRASWQAGRAAKAPAGLTLEVDTEGFTAEVSVCGDELVVEEVGGGGGGGEAGGTPTPVRRDFVQFAEADARGGGQGAGETPPNGEQQMQQMQAPAADAQAGAQGQAAVGDGLVSSPYNVQFPSATYFTLAEGGARCSLYNEPGEAWTQVTAESLDRKGLMLEIARVFDEGGRGRARLNVARMYGDPPDRLGRISHRYFVQQARRGVYGQVPRDRFESLAQAVVDVSRGDAVMLEAANSGEEALALFSIATPLAELLQRWRPSVRATSLPVRGVKKLALHRGVRWPGEQARIVACQVVPAGEPREQTAHVLIECPDVRGVFKRVVATMVRGLDLNIQRVSLITVRGTAVGNYKVHGLDWNDIYYARELLLRSLAAFERGQTLTSLIGPDRVTVSDAPVVPAESARGRARLRAGMDKRTAADPAFTFKVVTEICLDEFTAIITNIAVRGSILAWTMTDWVQVICHMTQAALNDFMLVYFLAPTGKDGEGDGKSRRQCAHVFQPGDFTLAERLGSWFDKAKLYGAIGMINTVLSRCIVAACIGSWETFTAGYLGRAALAGFVHMSLSSNTRYNIVNGIEVLLYRTMRVQFAQMTSVALRWGNMLAGSSIWISITTAFAL